MNIVVLSSRYPTEQQPYSHMFVHTRNKEYISKGHLVTVLVPSTEQHCYEIDGVKVVKGSVKTFTKFLDTCDGVMIHLLMHRFSADTDGGFLYDYIQHHNIPTLFFIHGVECQKIWRSRRDDIKLSSPRSIARFIYRDFYLIKKMQKTLLGFCADNAKAAFVTPSHWMSQESMVSTGIDTDNKTSIIPNGIDTTKFTFTCHWQDRHKVVSLRPLYEKGKYAVDLLIDAACKTQNKELSFHLYGDGPDKELIQQQVSSLTNFQLNVGFLKPEQISDMHQGYGVYAGVTRMDAQGVSMCEAMASGLPVVSFDTCAIPEFIKHNETGLLAKSYNVQMYCDLLNDLVNDKNLYTRLAEDGRKFIETIDIKNTTDQELSLLVSL